jgi:PAS domain S-box-containing protein
MKGETRYLEVQYIPHLTVEGAVDGLMVLGFDLTDLKKSNASLRNTEYKLQSVLNDRRTGYWDLDFASDKITLSHYLRERLGILPTEVFTNQDFLKIIHPDDRQLVLESTGKVLKDGISNELEYRLIGRDNETRWVFVTTHPLYGEDKILKGLMGITIDITEKKQMEQMIEAQKVQMLASARMSAIGEMASGVAHEINNPLTIILGNVELLKAHIARGTVNKKTVEHVCNKIDATVMRISKIIHSLRSLSRDGEKDPLEPIPAGKILEDALEICKQRFASKDIDLHIDASAEDVVLHARPTQISQVLLNLLNNAYDAVESLDERWVRLETKDNGDKVQFVVTDSGLGISQDLREKIFNPFFTTKDPSRGTGLGLSISRNIIRDHGGSMKLNEQSRNTQFIAEIPKRV